MRYNARYSNAMFGTGSPVLPGVKWLLIVNTVLFVLYFFAVRAGFSGVFDLMALNPRAVLSLIGIPQLVTYMFLHDPFGFWHILLNMLILWMFGTELERTWGTKRFLQYYLLCGVGAGIIVVLANLVAGSVDTRTIGASGAIYGLLLAFGVLFPDTPILFAFLFPIKAKYFVLIIGGIAFLSTFGASGSEVSHVAHLGGLLVGYLVLKTGLLQVDLLEWARTERRDWKIRRARRKFKVYMRKQGSDSDRTIH